MNVSKSNPVAMPNYARLIFLFGLILIIAAVIQNLIASNTLLTMLMVLSGLMLLTFGLVTVLVQTAKSKTKLVVNNNTVHDPADRTGALEAILYLFFLR